ncbi:MAG: hypothetical protein IKV44_03160 [Clostridia bacterium]|nr:hypothetical protein [Clostridia bacterium]
MKKKILAIVMTACIFVTAFVTTVFAAIAPQINSEIPVKYRFCPGAVIADDVFGEVEVIGNVYTQGWEIKIVGGDWIPYDGEGLDQYDNGASIRYFAANEAGDYAYSNECVIEVAHNPIGSYKYDGMNHWRDCADCDGQANKGAHTHLGEGMDETAVKENICKVCGQQRTAQYTGIKAFLAWLMSLITSLIG